MYRISSLIEITTGIALLVLPSFVTVLLVGTEANIATNAIAQLYGAAILCLGIAGVAKPCPIQAKYALLTYNMIAGVGLMSFALKNIAGGAMVWPAALIHLILGIAMIGSQLRRKLI